jgi:hypothetical protein
MATHDVSLQVSHAIPIGKVDIEIPVRKSARLLGTLTVSRGGLDWKKAHARKSVSVTWTQFAKMMGDQ